MNAMNKNLWEIFDRNLIDLNRTKAFLQKSSDKCALVVNDVDQVNDDALESCEALTARFARTVDILTQKVLKTIFLLLREEAKTFIDRCYLAEKLGLIDDAQQLINVRDLRSEIVHEYSQMELKVLFQETVSASKILISLVDQVDRYCVNFKSKMTSE